MRINTDLNFDSYRYNQDKKRKQRDYTKLVIEKFINIFIFIDIYNDGGLKNGSTNIL